MPHIARKITQFHQKEIDQLYKSARYVYRDTRIDIRLAPRSLTFGRILLSTPKKVGNAVVRNRIRRRIKSIFYQERLFEAAYDWIVSIKPPCAQSSFDELQALLCQVAQKVA